MLCLVGWNGQAKVKTQVQAQKALNCAASCVGNCLCCEVYKMDKQASLISKLKNWKVKIYAEGTLFERALFTGWMGGSFL